MTAHELARRLLNTPNGPVQIFDPDSMEWEGVTGYTYGEEGETVRLYSDDNS